MSIDREARRVWFEPTDRWPGWTFAMIAGGIGAVVLAVVGLPPWDLHGPAHYIGIMDPLCGMTRAVRYTAKGQFARAWRYNPGAALLALSASAALTRSLVGVGTGRWLTLRVGSKRGWMVLGAAVLVALEINQQAHAALLIRR